MDCVTPIAPVRAGAIGVCALLATGVLAGCSPAPAPLPSGVSVSIQQNRDDYGPRRLEIVVSNDGAEAITVTRASFDSAGFVAPAAWNRPATIEPGTTTNLRVQLAAADCAGKPGSTGASDSSVALDFTLPDGSAGSATVTPSDPFDAIATVTAQDCAADAVGTIVDVAFAEKLRTASRDGELTALLDLTFTPTGSAGSVTVHSVSDTILVRSPSSTGWGVEKTLTAASAPLTVTLDFIPNNCRLHTVAEDKRGTFFPLAVTLDARELTYPVAASTALKKQVYAYIADYCNWD